MAHYTYLILGGGMTGDAAIQGIRQVDPSGAIGLIGAEPHLPYNRPPLSKGLWKGDPFESIWRKTDRQGVEFHLGRSARSLDPAEKRVVDSQGATYTWDKLLLATGGAPRRLAFGGDHIIYFRLLDDYTRLRALTEHGQRFAVIGGGFIGSEVAAALAMNKKDVVMLFPEDGICRRIFPPDLSAAVGTLYREKGVELRAGETAVGLEPKGAQYLVGTKSGGTLTVDGVIAGIGIAPHIELARSAGLKTGNGIVVDERLCTSHPDIYAAGDVAEFYSPALGTRMRAEHEDNANTMGQAVGKAMAGHGEPYHHLPFFYSDLFELGYEAVGEVDARLETAADWKQPYREGVVYYLKDGRVRGVLLWNTWDQVDEARKLIAESGPFQAQDLKGRLPVTR